MDPLDDVSTDEVSVESGDSFNFDAAPPSTPVVTETTGGGNPAWNEALANIPKEFHSQLTPHFEKWDKGTQDRFSKIREEATAPYQPYQQFIDQKIEAQEVLAAYQVWQQLNADPVAMYNRMQQALRESGQLPSEAPVEELEEEETTQFQDPRVDQLQQQLQQLLGTLQQGQQQQEIQNYAAQVDQQINNELHEIETLAGGSMPEWLRLEVINRASMMTDREQRPVPLMEAFQEFQQVRAQMLANRPGSQAPRVVPNGGGFPAPQAKPNAYGSADERAERIREIIEIIEQSRS